MSFLSLRRRALIPALGAVVMVLPMSLGSSSASAATATPATATPTTTTTAVPVPTATSAVVAVPAVATKTVATKVVSTKAVKKKALSKKALAKKKAVAKKKRLKKKARKSMRAYAHLRVEGKHGWSHRQWNCVENLWARESGWRVKANNRSSGAYGIPQALPGNKMGKGWRTNGKAQVRWGLKYIDDRWGTPCRADRHQRNHHWY